MILRGLPTVIICFLPAGLICLWPALTGANPESSLRCSRLPDASRNRRTENEFASQSVQQTRRAPPSGRFVLTVRICILYCPGGIPLHRSTAAIGRRTDATFFFRTGPALGLIFGPFARQWDCSAGMHLNRFNSRLVPFHSIGKLFRPTGKRFLPMDSKRAANSYGTTVNRAN